MQKRYRPATVLWPDYDEARELVRDLDAVAALWQDDSTRQTARQLVDRSLLEPIGSGRFQTHALLAIHARSMYID